jgi:colicin import membrane protein
MARKLKIYMTTSGFYDLAVAAPSMKAALEIWGSKRNLFYQGFAKETDDPEIVKATMAQPGIVLKRAVGTRRAFEKNAELPTFSVLEKSITNTRPTKKPLKRTFKEMPGRKNGAEKDKASVSHKAAQLYNLAQNRLKRERARAEVQEKKKRARRERALESAEAALAEARNKHVKRVEVIEKEREALEEKTKKETERWQVQKDKLKAALDGHTG